MVIIKAKFVFMFLFLQGNGMAIEMADQLRQDGKIYVVVAVLVAIFLGIIAYLISIDKHISKLENNSNE